MMLPYDHGVRLLLLLGLVLLVVLVVTASGVAH